MVQKEDVSKTDVLIVGAGPAGLMSALWLSRMGVSTRIVDKRSTKIFTGQADGLQTRTLEVMQSFGLAEKIVAEANPMNEVTFWHPDDNGGLHRTARNPNSTPGISRFHQATLHQGRIERFCLDALHEWGYHVERGVQPTSLVTDTELVNDHSAHAVRVTLRRLSEEEAMPAQFGPHQNDGLFRSAIFADEMDALEKERAATAAANGNAETEEVLLCRYVIGCDGAASWVRKQLGYSLVGESRNSYWGVLDGVPISDFPDIRCHGVIHGINGASMQMIPRERGIVRHYIQLPDLDSANGKVIRSAITPEKLLSAARAVLHPFTLEVPEVEWFTCYEIGQRICANFHQNCRIFIAGDACHTHSPKAGQGMNVSMMDAYNLGWKIGLVAKGIAKPEILSSYQEERWQVAQNLIDFDKAFSAMYSGKPLNKEQLNISNHSDVYGQGLLFMSGTAANYPESSVIAKDGKLPSSPELAQHCPVGMRFKSQQVVCASDARAQHFADVAVSDGRWRVLLFGGDIREASKKDLLFSAAKDLEEVILSHTFEEEDFNSIIQVFAILTTPRVELDFINLPRALRPKYGKYSYTNHWQVFTDEMSLYHGHGHAYENWGIDPARPIALVVRPDGHVAYVTPLDGTVAKRLKEFFARNLNTVAERRHLGERNKL